MDALVGTKVSVKNVSVQTDKGDNLKSITVQSLSKDINIMPTRNRKRDSLREMLLSIIQREYHNDSTGKSPTALGHDRHLSGLRLAGVVDLSHDLEAVDLVPTSEGSISELGGASQW